MTRQIWTITICGGLILAIALGFRQTLGIFLPPIETDLKIGRENFALGIGLMNLLWGLGAPITGAIADRFGAVLILIVSGLIYAAGLAIMTISGNGEQFLTAGVLQGLALSGVGFSVILGVVGRAAPEEKRGLALGIASTLGSFGQFAATPFAHLLLDNYSWITTLLIMASCSLIIVPLAFGVSENRKSNPLQTADQQQGLREAFVEATSLPSFWYLTAGFFVCGFQVVFVAVHMPSYLADLRFEPWLGVLSLTLIGLGNIIGSFACGVLGDKYSKKYLLSMLYLLRSALITVFILVPATETSVIIFSFTIGLLWLGTVPLTSGLIAQIFGPVFMSMLFGIAFLSHQVGSFLGSWLAGRVYDSTGSYDLIWWSAVLLGIFASILHWPISEQPLERTAPTIAQ